MSARPSFARRIATASLVVLLMVTLSALVGYAANFFFLVFGSIIFAVMLSALSHFVSRTTERPVGAIAGWVAAAGQHSAAAHETAVVGRAGQGHFVRRGHTGS